MVDPRVACDLCGLELGKNAVAGQQGGLERHFCCPGCARVFEVASQAGMLEQALAAVRPADRTRGQEAVKRDAGPSETMHFSIDGMWCAGCAVVAERILRRQAGVMDAQVSFAAGMGRLQYEPGRADPLDVLHKLDGLGYTARLLSGPSERREERQQEHTLFQLLTAAGFGMQVMVIYIQLLYPLYGAGQAASDEARRLHYLAWLLTTPILFYGGISFLRGAWRALRARTATMDTLVALGTLSAYGYSVFVTIGGSGETYFDSVGMITTFVMLGRYLELLGSAQARKDVSRLLKLQPDLAWRLASGAWQSVPAATLAAGDEVLVKLGERVPADATILTGDGAVDESLMTGESLPVNRGPGEHILAGSVITDGAVTAKVTQPAEGSRLAQIARLVDQTLGAKAPIQRLADTASAWFAVGILAMAALTVAGWLITGIPWRRRL